MPDIVNSSYPSLNFNLPSAEQKITPAWQNAERTNLWVKRDDCIHPIVSGNKWRKLRYAIQYIVENNIQHIVSFGGGYSNHLHALGYACKILDIKLTAIVRGHYQLDKLTPMLQDLVDWQVDLQFVDRKTYQLRDQTDYLSSLSLRYSQAFIIPEGGSSHFALGGVADIIHELTQDYDYILAPVGSGGTLAGLIHGTAMQPVDHQAQILGIGVLKGQGYLEELVTNLLASAHQSIAQLPKWSIDHHFHFNGYAKATDQLHAFCQDVQQDVSIPIEPVYSGKLFWAAKELIAQQAFPNGSKILLLHTGGLQGLRNT
ncbi:MAG: pyridoxal-phosphate dependent enzyme [Paraglaciecola polaris]|uniref:1-aminocyclopropane-1-carboxylate deaminase/D-cysteine desulfhydrase n=1 Tax=Paraglaciecola polaris TaxID=222814 RepID=UPI003003A289